MRKYQLIIGDKELVLDYSSDNPTGVQLQFNIQQYFASQTVNAEITIYNVSAYYFTMNQSLIGKQIQLYAGMEENPITRMIGYSGSYGLIAAGFISAIIPEWNGVDSVLTIIFNPQPLNSQGIVITLQINKGEDIRQKYINAYSSITSGNLNINMGSTTITSKTSYTKLISSVSDLDLALQDQHSIKLNQTKQGFRTDNNVGNNVTLVPGDFVTQPSALDLGTLAFTLQMRADIQVGDLIKLPQNIYVGITALDNIRFQSELNTFQDKNVFLMFSGTYLINKVWQLGDSHNTSPEAWATILHGTRHL